MGSSNGRDAAFRHSVTGAVKRRAGDARNEPTLALRTAASITAAL